MAERQGFFPQAHDCLGRVLPPARGGGQDGPKAQGVQRGEDSGSVPCKTQTRTAQVSGQPRQPHPLHRLHHRCESSGFDH